MQALGCYEICPDTVAPYKLSSIVRRCCSNYRVAGEDPTVRLERLGKGKPIPAIVEGVASGSVLYVTLLPDFTSATVHVVGTQAPSMRGRRPAIANGVVPGPQANGERSCRGLADC